MNAMEMVRISTAFGRRTALADRVQGGLAVTLIPNDHWWAITHMRSGRRYGPEFLYCEHARELLEALLCLGDWDREEEEIRRDGNLREMAPLVLRSAISDLGAICRGEP